MILELFEFFASIMAHVCEMLLNNGCYIDAEDLWYIDKIGAETIMLATAVVVAQLRNLEREIAMQSVLLIILVIYKTFTQTPYFSGIATLLLVIYGLIVNRYVWVYFGPGLGLAIIGMIIYFVLTLDSMRWMYYLLHPWWHIFEFSAIPLILKGCQVKENDTTDSEFAIKVRLEYRKFKDRTNQLISLSPRKGKDFYNP